MNEKADPAALAQHEELMTRADTARLASLQYTYTPQSGGFVQTLVPYKALGERWDAIITNNQYAASARGNSTSAKIAKAQSVVEGVRQVLRMVNDVVGAGATITGLVASITGVLALIPPLTPFCGPVALAAGEASLFLTLIKGVLSFVDAFLGGVQMAMSVWRAHKTEDAAERARIVMQIKKEANETAGSLVSGGIDLATFGIAKGIKALKPANVKASEAAQVAAVKTAVTGGGTAELRAVMGALKSVGKESLVKAMASTAAQQAKGGLNAPALAARMAVLEEQLLKQGQQNAAKIAIQGAAGPTAGAARRGAAWVGSKLAPQIPKAGSHALQCPSCWSPAAASRPSCSTPASRPAATAPIPATRRAAPATRSACSLTGPTSSSATARAAATSRRRRANARAARRGQGRRQAQGRRRDGGQGHRHEGQRPAHGRERQGRG